MCQVAVQKQLLRVLQARNQVHRNLQVRKLSQRENGVQSSAADAELDIDQAKPQNGQVSEQTERGNW